MKRQRTSLFIPFIISVICIIIITTIILCCLTMFLKPSQKRDTDIHIYSMKPTSTQEQIFKWQPDLVCQNGQCPGIGQSFYLKKITSFSDPKHFISGTRIFNSLEDCVGNAEGGSGKRDLNTYSNTSDLVKKVSKELSLSGSYPLLIATVSASLQSITSQDVEHNQNIKSSSLDLMNEGGSIFVKSDYGRCQTLNNLNDSFFADFKKLPVDIKRPFLKKSWEPFLNFFNKWGSHVLMKIIYGSRFQQWESMTSTDDTLNKKLQIKACVSAEGNTSWSGSVCGAITDDEKNEVKNITTESHRIVTGGSVDARTDALLNPNNEDVINKFLLSADESDQGIMFQFTPVWEIMKILIEEGDNAVCSHLKNKKMTVSSKQSSECRDIRQRCYNMEAAYAFDSLKCERMDSIYLDVDDIADDLYGSDYFAQEFRSIPPTTGDDITRYGCWNRHTGCTTDVNCIWPTSDQIGICGYMGGLGAIEKGDIVGDPANQIYRNRTVLRNNFNWTYVNNPSKTGIQDFANNSCHGSGSTFPITPHDACGCDRSGSAQPNLPNRFIWKQE